jgi:DNA modification methylase
MTPYYEDDAVTLYCSDNLDIMAQLDPESFVSIVTDPPYGLAFMGKRWDYEVPSVATWQAELRLLKPGGHLLSFAGTRTQHRMAVNIEDAGFEIRDMIAWVYGSGFPKSLDVSKAIDKAAGTEGTRGDYKTPSHAIKRKPGNDRMHEGYQRPWRDDPEIEDRNAREYIPAIEAARQWSGYGSALKPALEPITLARKPLDGTLAANTLKHGCGGINVDGCRVGYQEGEVDFTKRQKQQADCGEKGWTGNVAKVGSDIQMFKEKGRWPANLIHDGSEEVVGLFPETTSTRSNRGGARNDGTTVYQKVPQNIDMNYECGFNDTGSAARFFATFQPSENDMKRLMYCPKASDREILAAESHPLFGESYDAVKNTHPTVKPLALMQWLIRLVTPPGGILLEPFAGSGTTLLAAKAEGRRAVGIEISEEYCEIAANRLREG